MIQVLRTRKKTGGRVIALGTFDGVHLGHQALIRAGREEALAEGVPLRVCTFDVHPLSIVAPEHAPALLTTEAEKKERMELCGADELRVMTFNQALADLSPDAFLNRLREECELRAVIAGWNYTFGRSGGGNAETLRRDGQKHGYRVVIVPSVRNRDGDIISSTAIRGRLKAGDLAGANGMLGYAYPLSGRVTGGKHLGKALTVATANVAVPADKLLPAYGVYTCFLGCGGEKRPAVVNIGLQPTLPSGQVTVEAHLLDGAPELYGKEVRLTLTHFLRRERKFETVAALKEQIEADIRMARKLMQNSVLVR